jgi:hypothetical protein
MLTQELGKYDAENGHDKYTVAAVADITADWHTDWINALCATRVSIVSITTNVVVV